MKALNPFSASVSLLLLVVMMMVMTVQTSEPYGETNADPDLPPKKHNGKLYYIREDNFTDVETARKNCAADNGKLVEIDSESEFNFVDGYLKSMNDQDEGVLFTYIGGQYQASVSKWILPIASTPVPFFHPSSNLVNYNHRWGLFCLALKYQNRPDWYSMDIASCISDSVTPQRYLCEKIQLPKGDLLGVTNADAHPKFRPVERNGKLYYIHKDNFIDFKLAQKKCAADGGILAEINDWDEYDFIQDYLAKARSQGVSYRTYIGARYSYYARRWNLPSTGQPLPVTRFRYVYDYRRRFFCILLKGGYHMWQEECHLPFGSPLEGKPTLRYLCEKIYAPYHPKQLPNADTNIPAIEFRDKIYYIHKKLFTDYQANLEDCKADGGMMAEINDGLEFQAVHKYVNSFLRSVSHVFIGGKKTGNSWVLPSTNQTLPYVKWGNSEPYVNPLPIFNCLILFKDKGWNMASMWCDSNVTPEYRFLCEMPLL